MKQIKLTDPTFLMLKELSPKKDAKGMESYLDELIMAQYKSKK